MCKLSLKLSIFKPEKKAFLHIILAPKNAVRLSLMIILTYCLGNQARLFLFEMQCLLTILKNIKFLRFLPEEHRLQVFLQ